MRRPLDGAVLVYSCTAGCGEPVTLCTQARSGACVGAGWLHLLTRLHKCSGPAVTL